MHNRKDRALGPSGEAVKSLLLNPYRNSKRISHRCSAHSLFQRPASGTRVRNCKFALRVVIFVKTRSPREQERALHIPPRIGAELEASSRQESFRNRKLLVLHSPRAQVLREYRCRQPAAELVLKSGVA